MGLVSDPGLRRLLGCPKERWSIMWGNYDFTGKIQWLKETDVLKSPVFVNWRSRMMKICRNTEDWKSFWRQSYLDAWEDYMRSIRKQAIQLVGLCSADRFFNGAGRSVWMSDQVQTGKGVLLKNTKFLVILILTEEDRIRGATLQVLRVLSEQEGFMGISMQTSSEIHSGGRQAKECRIQYVGNIFSLFHGNFLMDGPQPIWRISIGNGRSSSPDSKDGMLVLSGDVPLLFNFADWCALKELLLFPWSSGRGWERSRRILKWRKGRDHVQKFLYKQTVETDPCRIWGRGIARQCRSGHRSSVMQRRNAGSFVLLIAERNGQIQEDRYSQFVNKDHD